MFKNSLIISVILHLLLLAGLRFVLQYPGDSRPAHQHNPMLMVAIDSDFYFEEAVVVNEEEAVIKGDQKKSVVGQEQLLLNDHPAETKNSSVAGEIPPPALTAEKVGEEFLGNQPDNYQAGGEEPNAIASAELGGLNMLEPAVPPGHPVSPEPVDLPDHLPAKRYAPAPGYPYLARKNQWEGVTHLEILVQADGLVGETTVVQSSGYQVLDRAAVRAVTRWRYRPALKNGISIAWKLRIRIKFVLEG